MIVQKRYKITFLSPAFLGDAEKHSCWRTPPFKHLLREWWRVAYAAANNFKVDIKNMRREEGLLFGHAWLEDDLNRNNKNVSGRKSSVRLRLNRWSKGELTSWQGLEREPVWHPEVGNIGPHAYLAYGPLEAKGRADTKISEKVKSAIKSYESAELSIAMPEEHSHLIKQTLWLIDRYGTVGSRSRNGWGSCCLEPLQSSDGDENRTPLRDEKISPLREWQECLNFNWPHAIGKDGNGPLIWQTKPCDDWNSLLRMLALIKIGLRTQFSFKTRGSHDNPLPRHWLSYPVTKHEVTPWKNHNLRLPNHLRFKVRKAFNSQLVGIIYHMPYLPPPQFNPIPEKKEIIKVMEDVHKFLDELCHPKEKRNKDVFKKYSNQLDDVQLERIGE